MMKFLLVSIIGLLLLSACDEPNYSNDSTINNATVVSKTDRTWDWNYDYDYAVTVQKNNQKITFGTDNSNTYQALESGVSVDITYNNDFGIDKVTFPNMSDKQDK